jgi:hypothetical protein
VADAASALAEIAGNIDAVGRPLSAANGALPIEDDPYRRLWQAAGTLREHRGDGHVIALVAEDIAGITTLVLRSAVDLDAPTMQRARGWSDDEWTAEVERQIAVGRLESDGSIAQTGADAINRAEQMTNRLAVGPWAHLDDNEVLEIAALLAPISYALADLYPRPNPVGMPLPWHPQTDPDAKAVSLAPVV